MFLSLPDKKTQRTEIRRKIGEIDPLDFNYKFPKNYDGFFATKKMFRVYVNLLEARDSNLDCSLLVVDQKFSLCEYEQKKEQNVLKTRSSINKST